MDTWSIKSERNYHPGGAHHILYEWEDVIADGLGLNISDIMNPKMLFWDKVFNKVGLNLFGLFRKNKVIAFRMSATTKSDWSNSSKVIPWIVDFYIPREKFKAFFKATAYCKIVLISSMEVYESLSHYPLFNDRKYIHLPLSMPDKYKIDLTSHYDKKFDLIMLGRTDKLLMSFVKRYAQSHLAFTYVTRDAKQGNFTYFLNKNGIKTILCQSKSHDIYMDIMRSGKIGLWSTRGIEDKNCNGYNQVTPRLFELLTSGCHVVARYTLNPDTRYFELDSLCPNVDNYEIFCRKIEEYLHSDVDMDYYTTYMNKHYTSNRTQIIKDLLY